MGERRTDANARANARKTENLGQSRLEMCLSPWRVGRRVVSRWRRRVFGARSRGNGSGSGGGSSARTHRKRASETLTTRFLSASFSSRASCSSVGASSPDGSAAGPGFSLRNHSSPARAWRSKRANAASFCVSDSRSGWFGFPRMSHSSASVHPARGEERRKGEGRCQEAEADWRFSRARGARDCAHLAVPRAPPRAAGRTRTPSRPSALALSAVARRATVSDAGSLSSSNLLFSPVALTPPPRLAFSLK